LKGNSKINESNSEEISASMEPEKVDHWLRENSDRLGIDYRKLHNTESGESNHNFVVEGEEKLVLRVSRDISRKSRLENEAEKLDFLEDQNISRVPRKIHFEKDTDIGEVLLETYTGGEELDKKNFSESRIRSLASKVAQIHSIPVDEFLKFSGENIERNRTLKDIFIEDFRKWSERPYREYLKHSDNPDDRIKNFFQKQKELVKEVPEIPVRQGLCHGDLGFNIRATGDQVFIIDWEFSRIDYPGTEILYCFEHDDLSQEYREIFLDECC
jgi:aminoglycoside phosphotransferase (APT) family kinase protein